MATNRQKQHSTRPHSPLSDSERGDVSMNVTTNPRDAGAGGGTPLGETAQDSRTWPDGPENTAPDTDRETSEGPGRPSKAHHVERPDSPATLPEGAPHQKRTTL